MEFITALWLPILLSAVIVWIASAVVWMFMPHRKGEWQGLSNEAAVRTALREQTPGQYVIPWADRQEMKNREVMQKYMEGPVGFLTLGTPGPISMGKPMVLSFVYYLVVGIIVAYLASHTVDPGAEYLTVFRVVGTAAWLGYGFAAVPGSIWFGTPWPSTAKTIIEALAYGALTAGVFGWLWPS